eukprot:13606880-Alexandrium_andersonii.AAC.1
MDHPKLGMLKDIQDAAARDAVRAAIDEPLGAATASSAGVGEADKAKPKRGKKRARGKDVAGEEEHGETVEDGNDDED